MKQANRLLLLCMMLGTLLFGLTLTASATSGLCGDNVSYHFDSETGTLTLSKIDDLILSGRMTEYTRATDLPWNSYRDEIKALVLEHGVNTLSNFAFSNCTALTSVSLPSTIYGIKTSVFSNCTSLSAIHVDGDNQYYCSVDGVLFTKDMTTLIAYPAGKTDASYVIPQGVTEIEDLAFYGCPYFSSLTIPSTVEVIGHSAFYGNTALTEVVVPDGVEELGGMAFGGCTSLTTVVIPSSVTKAGYYIFSKCSALERIYYGGSWDTWTKLGFSASCTVYYNSTAPTATLSSMVFQVDGQTMSVAAYLVNDANFIKIRDLASLVNGSDKNFEVTWNQDKQSIELLAHQSYTPVGGELDSGTTATTTAYLNTNYPVYFNGELAQLTSYMIGDNSYFKLRDVMELVDIAVDWDEASQTVTLDSSHSYEE